MYLLKEPRASGLFRASPLAPLNYLALLRGEVVPKGTIPFAWISGTDIPCDVVFTDAVFPVLLSTRGRTALRSIKGWTSYPVSLKDPSGRALKDFHLLTVHGRCGRIDLNKSTPVEQTYPRGVFKEYRGIFFDENTWDRSDLFMPKNRVGYVLASEMAKEAIEGIGCTSPDFEPLGQVQFDDMTKEQIERV
jgi:hypothetical protein